MNKCLLNGRLVFLKPGGVLPRTQAAGGGRAKGARGNVK